MKSELCLAGFLFFGIFAMDASALRCNGILINEGDDQMKLLSYCGPPNFQDASIIGGTGTYTAYYTNLEYYNYRIAIVNGLITRIMESVKGI